MLPSYASAIPILAAMLEELHRDMRQLEEHVMQSRDPGEIHDALMLLATGRYTMEVHHVALTALMNKLLEDRPWN
uniref:Uncharacterized protein n=1 Tax=viral metagenome TaxID=1070528 RepID=A0A6M3LBZ4_9ZZZZ